MGTWVSGLPHLGPCPRCPKRRPRGSRPQPPVREAPGRVGSALTVPHPVRRRGATRSAPAPPGSPHATGRRPTHASRPTRFEPPRYLAQERGPDSATRRRDTVLRVRGRLLPWARARGGPRPKPLRRPRGNAEARGATQQVAAGLATVRGPAESAARARARPSRGRPSACFGARSQRRARRLRSAPHGSSRLLTARRGRTPRLSARPRPPRAPPPRRAAPAAAAVAALQPCRPAALPAQSRPTAGGGRRRRALAVPVRRARTTPQPEAAPAALIRLAGSAALSGLLAGPPLPWRGRGPRATPTGLEDEAFTPRRPGAPSRRGLRPDSSLNLPGHQGASRPDGSGPGPLRIRLAKPAARGPGAEGSGRSGWEVCI